MEILKNGFSVSQSLGLDKINGDLGEVYSVADLTCKFE
jgi:hypothetical protein